MVFLWFGLGAEVFVLSDVFSPVLLVYAKTSLNELRKSSPIFKYLKQSINT
ncbi:hypothetical protein HanRHA438_Chr02g0048051 [Helianthus annuus]|nr:hypothetical protein HanRHA438_Chr02g0048051 [Helianthus annuus]